MKENGRPEVLVSVTVVTYNSSNTVVETLKSIYNQTYLTIELVVSDDCSTDNTVEVCRGWIEEHKDRFVNTKLLTSMNNTGVSANQNRADAACCGEWTKVIAGDDVLFPDCIESYVNFVEQNKDAVCVFALMHPFGGGEEYRKRVEEYSLSQKEFFQLSSSQQYKYLTLRANRICAPTFFYNRKALMEKRIVCDERIPMMEDWPRWINLLKAGVPFHFLERETVLYRVDVMSISNQKQPSDAIRKSRDLFFIYYQFKEYYRSGLRRYALREYFRIKKEWGGWFWKQMYRASKRVL